MSSLQKPFHGIVAPSGRWARLTWARIAVLLLLSATWNALPAKALDLDELYMGTQHDDPKLPRLLWLEEGEAYLLEREDSDGVRRWYRVVTATAAEEPWLDPSILIPAGAEQPLEVDHVEFSADGGKALLATEREKRWRRFPAARYWVFDLASGELSELDPGRSPQLHAAFSPPGDQVAYVHQGNLYAKALDSGAIRPLTRDGGGKVLNGDPSWVYEEELGYTTGFWWSPDGTSIAFLRSDDEGVEEYPLVFTENGFLPRIESLPYPPPGSTNPSVKLGLLDLEGGTPRWVLDAGRDHYLGRVEWLKDGRLLLQELDRPQSILRLLEFRSDKNGPRLLLEERSEAWITTRSDIHFLQNGHFLRVSSRDGFAHVYLHDENGEPLRQITRGQWEVLELLSVDERADRIVVQTDRGDRAQRHLDAIEMTTGRVRRLSGSGGWRRADFDPQGRRYLESVSSLEQRPALLLREADGSLLQEIHTPSMIDLADEALGRVRFVDIPTADGRELPARILLPDDFDPGLRYPVLLYCYGGPGSQLVRDRWGGKRELFHRVVAQQGILMVSVDNRGTRGLGKEFLFSVYRRLGQDEAEDQIAAAAWLARQDYVDGDRIGIYGASYGGYLSAMSLLRGQGSFACAASVSPVSDWTLYDSIYTERYMGTPQDNAEAYEDGSLLSYVSELEGALFLLHGITDDNVHVQNTLRLAAALQDEEKLFEMMLYPDQDHGYADEKRRLHLRRSLLDFFVRHLGGPEAPEPMAE